MSKLFSDLEVRIQQQAQKYYTDGSQETSDAEFDSMVDELRRTNPDSDILKSVGWGYDINKSSSGKSKREHKYGLVGSLDKVHSFSELPKEFQTSNDIFISLKLDGLSVVLYYDKGRLIEALTRGNGKIGISVLQKVLKICPALADIDSDFTGAVRGEIVMSHENFDLYKAENPDISNARNAATGIIGRDEVTDDLKFLDIIVYTVVGSENMDVYDMRIAIDFLYAHFPKVVEYKIFCLDSDDKFQCCIEQLKADWYGVYPADGLVLTHNVQQEKNGYINYRSIAYKYPTEGKPAKVVDVIWTMSKTHFAVPRVQIEPIELCGATINYTTGFNAQFIQQGIGPGAIVKVERRGEVIPNIVSILEPAEPAMIDVCPCCGERLSMKGVNLVCTNPDCSNASRQDLSVWLSTLVPWDGLGDTLKFKFIDMLVEQGYMEQADVEDLMELEYDESMLPPVVQAIQFGTMLKGLKSEQFELSTALRALNIPRLGDKTSEVLANYPEFVRCFMNNEPVDEAELEAAVGNANAQSILQNRTKFERLKYIQHQINWDTTKAEFKGYVAITGKLSVPRKEFEALLLKNGWEVSDISRKTAFLITDNPYSSSAKNKKADSLNIPKMTELEFRMNYLDPLLVK